tara:strand:- start:1152 stop:2336 length:1185 start_codon:yes stop_codon:yes gene_type:complete
MELLRRDTKIQQVKYFCMECRYPITTKRYFVFVFFCLILTDFAVSNDSKKNFWEPDNWYQAEVVIFKHNRRVDDERPPANFELTYPHHWQKLIMLDTKIDVLNLAKLIEYGSNREVTELRKIEIKSQANNEGVGVLPNSDLLNHFDYTPIKVDQMERNYPKFELPYIKLQRNLRNLNETTMVLRRLPQYSVLFHNAWRFPINTTEKDPWIIVEAGSNINSRFELEGSLRFYKSRFLHFESNLWFSENDINIGEPSNVNFPILQDTKILKTLGHDSLRRATNMQESIAPHISLNADNIQENQTNLSTPRAEKSEIFHANYNVTTSVTNNINQGTTTNNQMVTALWTIDQSQRLKSSEVHYLDHPRIGIILTINKHQPLLLNAKETPSFDTNLDQK